MAKYRVFLLAAALVVLAACSHSVETNTSDLVAAARRAWDSEWHAVWQITWAGSPVQAPLVAEIWRGEGGRLRIETLEAPAAALNGLTLVDDGEGAWLYDLRSDSAQQGRADQVRIPLASDALDVMDWLLVEAERSPIESAQLDVLESGPATRLAFTTAGDERAILWVHDQTGLPAGCELDSADWGQVSLTTRSITVTHQAPALFVFEPPASRSGGGE